VDKLGKIQAGKMLPGTNWNEFSDLFSRVPVPPVTAAGVTPSRPVVVSQHQRRRDGLKCGKKNFPGGKNFSAREAPYRVC
jgi:hypothetical protein